MTLTLEKYKQLQQHQEQKGDDISTKTLTAIVSRNSGNRPAFVQVKENKGSGSVPDYTSDDYKDDYDKYDDMFDPNADQLLLNSGATIIRSEIEITDSQGRIDRYTII